MAYRYQQKLSRCIIICQDVRVQYESVTCGKTSTIVTWNEPCYCYAIKTNSRWIRSQARHAWHQDREPGCCAVCVLPASKLSLQELNQLIEIALLTSCFLENFDFRPNFQGRANARFAPPPADAHGTGVEVPDAFCKNTGHFVNSARSKLCRNSYVAQGKQRDNQYC